MRVSIIPDDNIVVIDGRGVKLDLSAFPALRGVHAVQWDTATEVCTIERRGNAAMTIGTLAPFQDVFIAAQLKLSEPLPELPPAEIPQRVDVIPMEYVIALLTRNVRLATELETEYIALVNTAPAAPGDTKEESTP